MVFNLSSCTEDLSVCDCIKKGALIERDIAGCSYLDKLQIKELEESVKYCMEQMMNEVKENLNKEN